LVKLLAAQSLREVRHGVAVFDGVGGDDVVDLL
jgi:hypothetical protein